MASPSGPRSSPSRPANAAYCMFPVEPLRRADARSRGVPLSLTAPLDVVDTWRGRVPPRRLPVNRDVYLVGSVRRRSAESFPWNARCARWNVPRTTASFGAGAAEDSALIEGRAPWRPVQRGPSFSSLIVVARRRAPRTPLRRGRQGSGLLSVCRCDSIVGRAHS